MRIFYEERPFKKTAFIERRFTDGFFSEIKKIPSSEQAGKVNRFFATAAKEWATYYPKIRTPFEIEDWGQRVKGGQKISVFHGERINFPVQLLKPLNGEVTKREQLYWGLSEVPPATPGDTKPAVSIDDSGVITGVFPEAGTYTIKAAVRWRVDESTIKDLAYYNISPETKWVSLEVEVIKGIRITDDKKNATGSALTPDFDLWPANRPFKLTFEGRTSAPKDIGDYKFTVSCVANKGFPATSLSGTFRILKRTPTVKWSGLDQPVGLVEAPVVTTTPAGLSYKLTYNGKNKLPDTPGAYTVRVSIPETELATSAQYSESFVIYSPGGSESILTVPDGFSGNRYVNGGGALVVLAKGKPVTSTEYGARVYGPGSLNKPGLPDGVVFSSTSKNDGGGFVQISGKESGTPSKIDIREVETVLTGRRIPPNQDQQFTSKHYQLYVVTDKAPSIVANQSFTVAFDEEVNIPVYLNDIVERPPDSYTVKNLPPGLRLETHLRYIDSFAYTIDPSTDTVFAPGSQLSNGQRLLRFQASDEPVYVRDVAGDRFKVSETPGGPAINFTRARKETLQVEVQSWFPRLRGKPTKGGTYSVELTASNPVGSDKKTFTIQIPSAKPKITFGATSLPFNGKAQGVPYTITPENAKHTVTYNGSATRPTNIGTYEVVVTVPEGNDGTQFVEAATAKTTFRITKATPVISFSKTKQVYDYWRKIVTATSTVNAPIAVTYDGRPADSGARSDQRFPWEPGVYKVIARIAGTKNYNSAEAETTLTIEKRTVRLEWGSRYNDVWRAEAKSLHLNPPPGDNHKPFWADYTDDMGGYKYPDARIRITFNGLEVYSKLPGVYKIVAQIQGSNYVNDVKIETTHVIETPRPKTLVIDEGKVSGPYGILNKNITVYYG